MTSKNAKVVLVEDHEISRLGLRMMIEKLEGVNVVAEAANGNDAMQVLNECKPDLVVLDIGLPDINGIDLTRKIKETSSAKIILLTSHDSDEYIIAGLSTGADAYCLKGISTLQLGGVIRAVLEGGVWLDPSIARKIMNVISHNNPLPNTKNNGAVKRQNNPFKLSEREMEVLQLLVEGMSNQQIASKLFVGQETVKTHMRHIMEKLCVSDRTQAAVKAVREGIVNCNPN